LAHSALPLSAVILPWNTTSYLVLIARSLAGVKVTLVPLHMMLANGTGMCLKDLISTVARFTDLQFIGRLKFTVTVVLMGTSTASSTGSVEITIGLGLFAAAALPSIPTTTTNAAIENLLTIYLSIIVIFLVENMAFISLVTCI
jgi:hypothetical protein